MPLRDDRRGKRATLAGHGMPLRADFRAVLPPQAEAGQADLDEPSIPGPVSAENEGPAPAGATLEEAHIAPLRFAVWQTFAAFISRNISATKDVFSISGTVDEAARQAASETPHVVEERSFAAELAAFHISAEDGPSPRRPAPTGAPPAPAEVPDAPSDVPFDLPPSWSDESRDECPATADLARSGASEAGYSREPEPVIVRTTLSGADRAVPLTRRPLRPQPSSITWPVLTNASQEGATRAQRHSLLREMRDAAELPPEDALLRAFGEEDDAGRVLVLQALMRGRSPNAHAVFVEALRAGGDEERALAVDGLAAAGNLEALPAAFNDRVDAIAARAALAYVGTHEAQDYRISLRGYLDSVRIEALLALLAGIVE